MRVNIATRRSSNNVKTNSSTFTRQTIDVLEINFHSEESRFMHRWNFLTSIFSYSRELIEKDESAEKLFLL